MKVLKALHFLKNHVFGRKWYFLLGCVGYYSCLSFPGHLSIIGEIINFLKMFKQHTEKTKVIPADINRFYLIPHNIFFSNILIYWQKN